MPEASESLQTTGLNWDATRHELTFFALYAAATGVQIWCFKARWLAPNWATFGRQLVIVFFAALLAGLIVGPEGFGIVGTLVVALVRVAIFAMLFGQLLVWLRIRCWRRGRSG